MDLKVVHISDENYLKDYWEAIRGEQKVELELLKGSPECVVQEIVESQNPPAVIVINLNYTYEGEKEQAKAKDRSQNWGIEVLKRLRLWGRHQHCLLYSALTREDFLLDSPLNLILCSPGVTFVDITSTNLEEQLRDIDLLELANRPAPSDLKDYFRAEDRLPDNRHFFANWWGVWQLWRVQEAIENKIQSSEEGVHGSVHKDKEAMLQRMFGSSSYKEMISYNGLVARYLRNVPLEQKINEKNSQEQSAEVAKTSGQETETQLRDRIKECKSILNFLQDKEVSKVVERIVSPNSQREPQTLSTLWQSFLRKIRGLSLPESELTSDISNKLKSITAELTRLYQERIQNSEKEIRAIHKQEEEVKSIMQKIERYRQETAEQLQSYQDGIRSKLYEKSIIQLRQELIAKRPRPKILYVDDQAEDGWACVLRRIIYGEQPDCQGRDGAPLYVISPKKNFDIEELTAEILKEVKDKQINLVILDLRLRGEVGNNIPIDEISGLKVLRKLRMGLPCPVLITTASNKVWSYRKTLAYGAMAYWVKQGLDSDNSAEDTVQNYKTLIETIDFLCDNKHIEALFKIKKYVLEMREPSVSPWWVTMFPDEKDEEEDCSLKNRVLDRLHKVFDLYQGFINLELSPSTKEMSPANSAQLILSTFMVIEDIFEQAISLSVYENRLKALGLDRTKHIPMVHKIRVVGFDLGSLTQERNNAAHNGEVKGDVLLKYIDKLLGFLKKEPSKAWFVSKVKNISTDSSTHTILESPFEGQSEIRLTQQDFNQSDLKKQGRSLEDLSDQILHYKLKESGGHYYAHLPLIIKGEGYEYFEDNCSSMSELSLAGNIETNTNLSQVEQSEEAMHSTEVWYETRVVSVHSVNFELFYLEAPKGYTLEDNRTNILLHSDNVKAGKDELRVGAVVRYQINVAKKNGMCNYYAENAQVVVADSKSED